MRISLNSLYDKLTTACAVAIGVTAATAAHAVGPVAISQVYGGGGNAVGTYSNDFVEIRNRGNVPVNLGNWSLQYASATGTGNFGETGQSTNLPAVTLQPGQYFLMQGFGAGSADTLPMPAADVTGVINLSSSAGKVALVTGTTSLGCNGSSAPCSAAQLGRIVDLVGYGTANFYETSPAPALSNTLAALRANGGCTDTDSNIADFVAGAAAPRNSATVFAACNNATLTIAGIQGAGHVSPYVGQVAIVTGIVTAVRATGFFFQDATPDGDSATSDGMFVFTSSAPTVAVGDAIQVIGTVMEFRAGNLAANLTITEFSQPSIIKFSSGNALPSAVVLGTGGRAVPTQVIEDDATGDVETSGAFDPSADGIDFFESLEGMRVQINDPVAVGPTNSFGELPVLVSGGVAASVRTTRGGIVVRSDDFNPERLILDDMLAPVPVVNTGDALASVTAIVDYSVGNYKFAITSTPAVVDNALVRQTSTVAGGGQRLSIATYNVSNLSAVDSPQRFETIARQIVTQLRSPDILSLTEIQDNNGAMNDGSTDASQTFQKLIDAIALASGIVYQYRSIAPVNGQDGGVPGANIRIGFLFNPARVTFVDRVGGTATIGTAVLNTQTGPQLLYSPGRIDPLNPSWNASRKPLAGEFLFNGKRLFVIGNHFNSKGGDDPLYGRNQPPVRSSEVVRNAQAAGVSNFVQQILAIDAQASVVVLGDFNDYQFSDAVSLLKTNAGLVNLVDALPESERYTYLFDGNSQALDHILVSPSIANNGLPVAEAVHVNAEFATSVSDHDPLVAAFAVGAVPDSTPPVISVTRAGTQGDNGWFVSAVSLTWSVIDAESTVISRTGCDAVTVTTDTAATVFTCTASSAGGSNTLSTTVGVDMTAPVATATPSPLPNADGWNKTSVTVTYSGVDATSGIAGCSTSSSLTAEGAGQSSSSGTCTDAAGNTSAPASATGIDIDRTVPVVTATPTPAPNASGWNTSPVTITYTAIDSLSGVAPDGCDTDMVLTNDGMGQSASGTCRDIASNQGSGSATGIDIDRAAPVAVATAAPAANGNGWNNTNVTVSFAATDGLSGSGVASCAADVVLSTEGTGLLTSGSCSDVAGNASSAASATTNIDKTAPSASLTTPGNGASYQQGSVVAASYECSDARSGVDQCVGTVANGSAIDTTTLGAKSFSVNVTDNAGNAASANANYTVVPTTSDTTAPVIAPVVTGTAGNDGWYRSNVAVSWSITDPDSPLTSTSGCSAVTVKQDTDAVGTTFTCQATSDGGTSSRSIVVRRDTVAPTSTVTSPQPKATYSPGQTVLAAYSCQDGLSGVAQCSGTVVNGAAINTASRGGKQFTVIARDEAGNAATRKVSYKVQ